METKPKSSALCVKSTAKEDECTAVSVAKMMNALYNTSRIFSSSLFVFFLFLQNNKLFIDFTGKVLSSSDSASFLADSVLSAYSIIIISLCCCCSIVPFHSICRFVPFRDTPTPMKDSSCDANVEFVLFLHYSHSPLWQQP